MASTEERIRRLVDENLEIEGRPMGQPLDLNSSLRDMGVSSLDLVAFAKLAVQEFGIEASVEECADITSIGEFVDFLDAKAA